MTQNTAGNIRLGSRMRAILFTTIAEYVSTGRAVSSMSLAKNQKLSLSPATIRRELQELTETGFLIQPHRSAGRIPTDRAFRLFVDALREETHGTYAAGSREAFEKLRKLGVTGNETWHDLVRILSRCVLQAALVITPAITESVLRQLRFVPIAPGSLLAVLVTKEGLVHNSFVESPEPLDNRDLDRIHNYLETLIVGHTLNEIRSILREELRDARARCDALGERAALLGKEALRSSFESKSELVVEGRSHLAAQPDLRDRLEALMLVLDEKTRILSLLDQAAEKNSAPIVVIGREGGDAFNGCAMISAPFGRSGGEGQIGIIGSSRMNYSAVIPLVGMAAELLTGRLTGEKRRG